MRDPKDSPGPASTPTSWREIAAFQLEGVNVRGDAQADGGEPFADGANRRPVHLPHLAPGVRQLARTVAGVVAVEEGLRGIVERDAATAARVLAHEAQHGTHVLGLQVE